jgi:hypothetical protein
VEIRPPTNWDYKMTENNNDHAEAIIATLARVFKLQNQQQELEILIHAEPKLDWVKEDWGVDYYNLILILPFDVYRQVRTQAETIQESILNEVNSLISATNEEIFRVRIAPKIEYSDNWREEIRSLSETQFGIPQSETQYQADIFMLMPFTDDQLQQVYRDHIVKVIKRLNMTIKRGDDFFSKSSIMQDIWAAINMAKVIIADCTSRNPNVFYELGIAHALGKKTIMITRNESDIPFDLRQWRYIKYIFTPRGMAQFETDLSEAVKKLETPPPKEIDNIGEIPF